MQSPFFHHLAALLLCGLGLHAQPRVMHRQPDVSDKHLLLHVLMEEDGFRVLEKFVVNLPLPKAKDTTRYHAWRFETVDRAGQPLFECGMDDPTIIRGEFHDPQGRSQIEGNFIKAKLPVSFVVRVPMSSETQSVRFFNRKEDHLCELSLTRESLRYLGDAVLPVGE